MTSATKNGPGVFLVHGLGGTQYDLGAMHKHFKNHGFTVHSLTLPGHGTQPEDLIGVTAEHWLDAVTAKYREALAEHETLHVIGMCLGSLLATEVVKRERHDRGRLAVLAPPIYIDGWATPWYVNARHLLYRLPLVKQRMRIEEEDPFGIKNDLIRSIVKAKFERGEAFHYRWVPLHCIEQVDRLRGMVMRGLDGIRCETLIIHAREDELTSPRSAEFLVRNIGSHARMIVLENSYHMVCVDNDRDFVAIETLKHFGVAAPQLVRRRVDDEETAVKMSAAEIREIASRYFTELQAGRFEQLLPLFASDVVWHAGGPARRRVQRAKRAHNLLQPAHGNIGRRVPRHERSKRSWSRTSSPQRGCATPASAAQIRRGCKCSGSAKARSPSCGVSTRTMRRRGFRPRPPLCRNR